MTPLPPNPWGDGRRRRIGLLGGSFNPAHDGHRHISVEALKRCGLDEVWWLVSPQNPLKPRAGMAPLAERLAAARAVAAHPRISASSPPPIPPTPCAPCVGASRGHPSSG
jgi:nicotinate-nucleotide adenylyltransferase